jgi:hypothetical protein
MPVNNSVFIRAFLLVVPTHYYSLFRRKNRVCSFFPIRVNHAEHELERNSCVCVELVNKILVRCLSPGTTRLRASTEVDENGGRHLTRLPGWKQIPCESEAGFQLALS